MTNAFFTHHKLFLTPLSPIHIGCGEDFEPTNYILDENVLYNFEASKLGLTLSERQELLSKIEHRNSLPLIQNFFLSKKEKAKFAADYYASVSSDLMQEINLKIGKPVNFEKEGNRVYNKLTIERNSYLPFSFLPYIPGSSIKGVFSTAMLNVFQKKQNRKLPNEIYQEKDSRKIERIVKDEDKKWRKELLGDFKTSIFSLFKISDFMPTSESIFCHIQYVTNHKKSIATKIANAKGVTARRECIHHGQYRSFRSELSFWDNKKQKENKPQDLTLENYVSSVNQYHFPIFKNELEILINRKLISSSWKDSVLKLLSNDLKDDFQNGKIMLIRVGRNTGAESKSYREKGIARIKIMRGKGNSPDYRDEATTIWLASDSDKSTQNLLPLGWALIEIDPSDENRILQAWSESQQKPKLDRQLLGKAKRENKEMLVQQQQEQELKRLAKQRVEQQKQALFQSASENQKQILTLVEKFKSGREKVADMNSVLLKEVETVINTALVGWNNEEKQFAFEQLTLDLVQTRVDFKRKNSDKNYNKLRNKLIAEV